MNKARILFLAALTGLSALAGAHHGLIHRGGASPAAGLPEREDVREAGSRLFVSTFPGGDFALPGAGR